MKQSVATNQIRQADRPVAVALALGMLGVVGFHVGLFSSGFDRIPGDEGDARASVYLVEHWYQVFQGSADALLPRMFYPVEGLLGYTDTKVVFALPYSLLRLGGVDMFSAMAATLVLFSLLNYFACFFLLHRVLKLNATASCVGAMFFAFNSPRVNHPGHYVLQVSFFLPLALVFAIRFLQKAEELPQQRSFWLLAAASLCVIGQLVASLYQGWFIAFWSFLFIVLVASHGPTRSVALRMVRTCWPALTGAAVVLGLGILSLSLIYAPAARALGSRPYRLIEPLIPEWWSLLQMGNGNYVWGGASAALTRMHPLPSTEHNIGIGLVPSIAWLVLTMWALWTVNRQRAINGSEWGVRDVLNLFFPLMILTTTLFYAIGMKYANGASPWRLVYLAFPSADGLRAVARYVLVLALPMAIAFAVVVHRGMRHVATRQKVSRRQSLAVALMIAIIFGLFEQFGRTSGFSKSRELARLRRLAAKLPEGCAAFYVAAAPERRRIKYEYQIDAMLISSMRHVPTLNGYSAHVPPGWSLGEVEAPDYEQRIAQWIARHKLRGNVCRLEIGD